ncbi:hypothetical protein J6590_051783 [Homalodisca vitripennis]|nr:hypothetical protein J6590_051783 [Homalodisca vitripennis]
MLVTEIVETRSADGAELHNLLVSEKRIKKIKVSRADEENILISLDDGSQQISKSFTIVLAAEEDRGCNPSPDQSRCGRKIRNYLSLRNVLIFVQIVLFVVSLVMLWKLATYARAPKSPVGGCLVDPECVRKLQDKGPFVKDLLSWLLQTVRDSSKDQLGIKMSYRSGRRASLDDLSGIDFIVLPNNRTGRETDIFLKL